MWVLNWLEPIKKTYYSPAEDIDVVGKCFIINYVTIDSFEALDCKKDYNEGEC